MRVCSQIAKTEMTLSLEGSHPWHATSNLRLDHPWFTFDLLRTLTYLNWWDTWWNSGVFICSDQQASARPLIGHRWTSNLLLSGLFTYLLVASLSSVFSACRVHMRSWALLWQMLLHLQWLPPDQLHMYVRPHNILSHLMSRRRYVKYMRWNAK